MIVGVETEVKNKTRKNWKESQTDSLGIFDVLNILLRLRCLFSFYNFNLNQTIFTNNHAVLRK